MFLPTHFFKISGSLYYNNLNVNHEKKTPRSYRFTLCNYVCIILYTERTTNAYAIILTTITSLFSIITRVTVE